MGSSPMMKSALTGIAMQAVMVLVGKFVPALGQMPNFYAICGTVLAALTGAITARNSPGATGGTVATNGAVAGGVSSIVGGVLAVVSGQWPGFSVIQLLVPALSGGVAGALGGTVTRMTSKPRVAA